MSHDQARDAATSTVERSADKFIETYRLRNPSSITFATYSIRHIVRLLGKFEPATVSEETVVFYQTTRLKESAAPKTVNEEVGFLLRILGSQGDDIRESLKRQKSLKIRTRQRIAKAFNPQQKAALIKAAQSRRSAAIVPALVLALNTGIRNSELRNLQWERVDLERALIIVGRSKTQAGEGRTVPLNQEALAALQAHRRWYVGKFGQTRPEWYVFCFGRPQPTDPSRPVGTLRSVWAKTKAAAGVHGRWHDARHTFITDLAESGKASDETIRNLAGHVSAQMLSHYSHIRMKAKREAVDSLTQPLSRPPEQQSPFCQRCGGSLQAADEWQGSHRYLDACVRQINDRLKQLELPITIHAPTHQIDLKCE